MIDTKCTDTSKAIPPLRVVSDNGEECYNRHKELLQKILELANLITTVPQTDCESISDGMTTLITSKLSDIIFHYTNIGRHRYHCITKYIYESPNLKRSELEVACDYILAYIKNNTNHLQESLDCNLDDFTGKLGKIDDHLKLGLIQHARFQEINRKIPELEKSAEEIQETLNDAQKNTKNLIKKTEGSIDRIQGTYTVTIGLFVAVLMTFVGGFTVGTQAFFQTGKLEPIVLLTISIWLFFTLFLAVYGLLSKVSQISNRGYTCPVTGKTCDTILCKTEGLNTDIPSSYRTECTALKRVWQRHSVFIVTTILFILLNGALLFASARMSSSDNANIPDASIHPMSKSTNTETLDTPTIARAQE